MELLQSIEATNLVMYRWEINYRVYPCVVILPVLRGSWLNCTELI